jgi:GDP-L-fucose synthase
VRTDSMIYVAGIDTLIGAAILRRLRAEGYQPLTEDEPDLTCADAVEAFFTEYKPEYVVHAAGRSGGIAANQKYPADLLQHNLLVNSHVIDAAHRHGVNKLLYLASSCSYPRLCPQPMAAEHLMTGPLEPTNAAYATAKLAGIELCRAYRQQHGRNFIVGIPANAFGPGDDYDPENAHVIGALVRRMHEAKEQGRDRVTIWGSGTPQREFIFAADLADACLLVMRNYDDATPINLGGGSDVSIAELAQHVRDVVGFRGRLEFDRSRPDGMPRKALDGRVLAALGWRPRTPLRDALALTYQDFLASEARRAIHA